MLTVTKRFEFEAAHHLPKYEGACKRLHGHSYKLYVTVSHTNTVDREGFVMDFKKLKNIVDREIIHNLDHQNLNEVMNIGNPTAENMLLSFKLRLKRAFPAGIMLEKLKLYETEDSYAEWINDPS